MGVKKETWTGEAIRQFTHTGEFLSEIPDYSRFVENDVIHLVKLGVKPDVLVDNTTYPIPVQAIEDEDVPVSLSKFQTKSTDISDDDLESASYQIISERVKDHAEALEESTGDKSAHALAPAAHGAKTPIITTTGDENELGHKAFTVKDIIKLKKAWDDKAVKVPKKGRILVLCSQHIADLLNTSEAFEKQYKNIADGTTVPYLYGFKIYEHSNCPQYYLDGADWKKRTWKAEEVAGDREASFAFYAPRMLKARGSVKFYNRIASTDPDTQTSRFNYKLRFICIPKTSEGIAAIVSPDA